ncbi:hypothetical protein KH5H1_76730 [Corallococcus caeni]|uniref:Lipoprotein n=2 Tax=Corallococcus TaxID=83461 RepID=A0A7Y4NF70_9BACT|nr:hypothetical protein [Corallococcus exercitus]NOK10630.1 hypothetical protein [Corallococcus exercitus]GMU03550.1 hypothetical protein KH5H1_76730 [Corallococcus sp. KH5-1]GMU11224.1 hypothetical protein ASNO1_74780 [Corallococcus sp. NO1]
MLELPRIRWALAVAGLGLLGTVGCVRTVPYAQRVEAEDEKCTLLQALMRQPAPAQAIQKFVAEGKEERAPVVVYVRHPEEATLERFFTGDTQCANDQFKVVQENVVDAVVVYLQEVQGGYAYDAQRSSPEHLTMDGRPQGTVRKDGATWVAGADVI